MLRHGRARNPGRSPRGNLIYWTAVVFAFATVIAMLLGTLVSPPGGGPAMVVALR